MDSQLESIKQTFGIDDFREGQRKIVTAILNGEDVSAIMPTGSGKSLCYQAPSALWEPGEGLTLVISPLIALMRGQVEKLLEFGINAAVIHSGIPEKEKQRTLVDVSNDKTAILYCSPEQLANQQVAEALTKANIARMAVDEAHCIAKWGHDFRPEFLQLNGRAEQFDIDQKIAVTTTASDAVEEEIADSLGLKDPLRYNKSPYRENLKYITIDAGDMIDKIGIIKRLIKQHAPNPTDLVLIYCARKDSSRKVAVRLDTKSKGLRADFYNAGLEDASKQRVEKQFASGRVKVLVTTNAFGMGIDIPNIRLVIHLETPGDITSYIQETGRAGRDGEKAHCALLYSEADLAKQEYFIENNLPSMNLIESVLRRIMKQAPDEEYSSWFKFDRTFIKKGYERKAPVGVMGSGRTYKTHNQDGKVNTAMDLLLAFGIIKIQGQHIRKFKSFNLDSEEYEVIRAMLETRREALYSMLEVLKEYAAFKGQDPQKKLMELLKKDPTIPTTPNPNLDGLGRGIRSQE